MGKPWVSLLSHWLIDELRLTTFAVRRDHQVSRHVIGYGCSKILTDDVKAKIDAGSSPGRSQDVFFIYIQRIRHDFDLRIQLAQLFAKLPMSCCASAIQKAGGCQHKCSAANRYQAGSALMSHPQQANKPGWRWNVWIAPAG